MRSSKEFHAHLGDARRYEREIERLHAKHLFTSVLYELRQDNVALAQLIQRRRKVGKLLARAVSRGEYELEPGEVREIEVDGKIRVVVSYRLTDTIVRGVVSTLLEEAIAPRLSDRVYSYRRGTSWLDPSAELAAYIRAHRRQRPDPRTRGLYVLRRDVHSYTDTIPVDRGSRVWEMLRDAIAAAGTRSIDEHDWRLVEQTVRPDLRELGGGLACRVRGVPTGQPISCVLFNLYLSELDHALTAVPDGFYARYSDDFLFVHPDAATAREAAAAIDSHVSSLRLAIKPDKASNLYLTAAGRRSAEWPETRPTSSVPFVGTSVLAAGTVALNRKKLRRVLREVERRARRTAAAMRGADRRAAGRAVCSVVNDMIAPRPTPLQQASAPLLGRVVTDRGQLAQIDYRLARMVVGAVTGDASVRAFRRVSYRTVREEWGLASLEHARNLVP